MKAWRVIWLGMPKEVSIVAAFKRSQASASVARLIEECGYKEIWNRLRCTRAPEYDSWASAQKREGRSILEEYAAKEKATLDSDAAQ